MVYASIVKKIVESVMYQADMVESEHAFWQELEIKPRGVGTLFGKETCYSDKEGQIRWQSG